MGVELQILDWLQTLHTSWLDQLMRAVTALGDKGIVWILLTVLLLLIPKTRKVGAAMAIALVLEAVCCNLIIKPLVARTRPFDVNTTVQLLISRPTDFSFPSGHTGASFAVVFALYFGKNKLWIASCVLAVLIAFSRLYFYVHYPSDVLAGAVLGAASGWAGSRLAGRLPCFRET